MRVKLVDIDNRLSIKYNKSEEIHNWGDDNAYPQLVKSVINSSVTTKQCIDLLAKYTYGKGFQFTKEIDNSSLIINSKGLTINQLLREVSKQYAEIKNVFIHVNYNALFEITSVDILNYEDVRIGKIDSLGYNGKFIVYNNWDKTKGKKIDKNDFLIIDRFNPNPKIIELQVEAAGGWKKYKGQILHLKNSYNEIYGDPNIDSIIREADSEFQASVFKNQGLRKGFFGAKLLVTKPFEDDFTRRAFEKTIQDLKGADNSSGVLLLETSMASDNLNEHILIQNIDSNIDIEKFEKTELSTARNIRKAFGVPSILIEDSDNSIFGQSGELIKQAKLTFWENNELERDEIIQVFQTIFKSFHKPINPSNNWEITPIINLNTDVAIN